MIDLFFDMCAIVGELIDDCIYCVCETVATILFGGGGM